MNPTRAGELTDGAVLDYLVLFPSGQRLGQRGRLGGLLDAHGHYQPYIDTGAPGPILFIDPRAIVLHGEDIAYNPRRAPRPLDAAFADWLAAHPEWPQVATEATP